MSKDCNPLAEHEFNEEQFQSGKVKEMVMQDTGQHEFRIENQNRHHLVKLNLVEDNTRKTCDFLVLDCDASNAYFVELKGKKLTKAVDQIISTIDILSRKVSKFQFLCRIVQTRVIGNTFQNDKERLVQYLKRKHESNSSTDVKELVKIGSQKLIEKI